MLAESYLPTMVVTINQLLRPIPSEVMDRQALLNREILTYILSQFTSMCQASSLELQKVKVDLQGKCSYPYLQTVVQLHRNARILYKKITMNQIVKKAFRDHMLGSGHFDEEILSKYEYLLDLLFLNILDQIFIQTVYEPNKADIVECFNFELT